MNSTKIILAGEGGQGIQTIAKIIAKSAVVAGYETSYIPSFGVEQRGAPSVAFVIVGRDNIMYPRFDTADYVIVLQKRALKSIENFISHTTKLIFDSSTISAHNLPKKAVHVFGIPATKYAYENFIPKSFNLIIAGKICRILNFSLDPAWQTVHSMLKSKFQDDKIKQVNKDAFAFGYNAVFEIKQFTEVSFAPSTDKIISIGYGKKGEIVPARCKGCGICIEKCPVRALKFSKVLGVFATPVPEVDLEKCITCGNCRRFCPDGAISIEKK